MTIPSSDQTDAGFTAASAIKSEVAIDAGVGAATRFEASPSAGTLDRSFLRGIAWQGSVKWGVQVVTWGATILVARILSPSDYGLLTMGNVLLTFITLLSESGLGITVVRTRAITAEQIAQINGAALLLGFACFAVACLAAVPVGLFYRAPELPPVIVAMGLALIITAFRVVPGALLQRDLRFPRLAVIDGAQGLLQAAATITLATLGFRYWSLVLGALLGAAFGTAVTVASRPYKIKRPRRETLRPMFSFTREVLATRLLWYIYQDSDFVVAGRRLTMPPCAAIACR
jgi:PST family polysaccharide transporter